MMKKVVLWGLVAFLVFYIVTQPTQAANIFQNLGTGVGNIADGFTAFVNSLGS